MMPREKSSGCAVPFTTVPNTLIDEVMPTLKDTEWRLLCVIVRQTLGRAEADGQRKQRDWMSQSQLIAKTGRNSAALSAALDVLVQQNLVECQAENGQLLSMPQQRRRHRGRLYFGLAPRWTRPTKSELQKANWTKEKENKRKNINMEDKKSVGLYSVWKSASEIAKERGYKGCKRT